MKTEVSTKLSSAIRHHRVCDAAMANLVEHPTQVANFYKNKTHYQNLLTAYRDELAVLQSVLYAHDRYAVLLIFQGMDTAGKDGAIRHVMSGINPQGCQVFNFKQPSREELSHDFLWRTNKRLPERGRIGIFNRSYYEEVLIARVSPDVLQSQRLPAEFVNPDRIWEERFRDIVNLEDFLHRNGTRIVKFFLHISKEEQRQRLLKRIDDPEKNWKMTRDDITVRQQWDAYQSAYADCLGATSTEHAPWHVIPADDKRNARLLISSIIVETMKTLRMNIPKAPKTHRQELTQIRRRLENEPQRSQA